MDSPNDVIGAFMNFFRVVRNSSKENPNRIAIISREDLEFSRKLEFLVVMAKAIDMLPETWPRRQIRHVENAFCRQYEHYKENWQDKVEAAVEARLAVCVELSDYIVRNLKKVSNAKDAEDVIALDTVTCSPLCRRVEVESLG